MLSDPREAVSAVRNRPLRKRNRVGAVVAMLTCPCHLGVAIILLGGTAVGGWLAAERAWLYVLFTLAFVGGLVTLFWPSASDCDDCRL